MGGTLLYRRLTRAAIGVLLIVISLAGVIPPLWQFFSIRSVLDRLYGRPIQVGWGLWLMVAGFLVLATAGTRALIEQKVGSLSLKAIFGLCRTDRNI